MFEQLIERLNNLYDVSLFDDGGELSAVIGYENTLVNIYEMPDKSIDISIEEILEDGSYVELDSSQYKRVGSAYNYIVKMLG